MTTRTVPKGTMPYAKLALTDAEYARRNDHSAPIGAAPGYMRMRSTIAETCRSAPLRYGAKRKP